MVRQDNRTWIRTAAVVTSSPASFAYADWAAVTPIVAEDFGHTFPQFKAPVVGSGGSYAGVSR
jgi:hypothetical protein